jgi:integrase
VGFLRLYRGVGLGLAFNSLAIPCSADRSSLVVDSSARPSPQPVALAQWHSETERRANGDYIFPDSEGGFCHKENYQRRVLTPLAEQAGLDHLNFQILRRTVATQAQSLGSPKDISTIMRHSKTETAQQHYIMAIEASVKETTERLASKMLSK